MIAIVSGRRMIGCAVAIGAGVVCALPYTAGSRAAVNVRMSRTLSVLSRRTATIGVRMSRALSVFTEVLPPTIRVCMGGAAAFVM